MDQRPDAPPDARWHVAYRDGGVTRYVPCASRAEAERLAEESRRLWPHAEARADWYMPSYR